MDIKKVQIFELVLTHSIVLLLLIIKLFGVLSYHWLWVVFPYAFQGVILLGIATVGRYIMWKQNIK